VEIEGKFGEGFDGSLRQGCVFPSLNWGTSGMRSYLLSWK
jgi:hypothetical protein